MRGFRRINAVLIVLMAFGCKTPHSDSGLKDNEMVDNQLTKFPLGQGFLLPPIQDHDDILSLQPAQAVCVLPPDKTPPPPVHPECTSDNAGFQRPVLPDGSATPDRIEKPKAPRVNTGNRKPKQPEEQPAEEQAPEEAPAEEQVDAAEGEEGTSLTGGARPPNAKQLEGTYIVDAEDPQFLPDAKPTGFNLDEGDGNETVATPAAMGGDWTGDIQIVTNQQEAETATQLNLQVGSSVPVISGGLAAQVRNEMKDTNSYFYVVFRLVYKGYFDTISTPAPSSQLQTQLTGGSMKKDNFLYFCGNRYMRNRLMGGIFYGVARFEAKDKSRMNDIQLALAEVRSTYTPGVKAGGGIQNTTKFREAFSTANIKFHKLGGADRPQPLSLEGMVAAMGDFICSAAEKPYPLVAWLASYRGGLGGQIDEGLLPVDDPIIKHIGIANSRIADAREMLAKLDEYPSYQQPQLATHKDKLNEYIGVMQRALKSCKTINELCDETQKRNLKTLLPPYQIENLPKMMTQDVSLTHGKQYSVFASSAGWNKPGLWCGFGFNAANRVQGMYGVYVTPQGTDLSAKARISIVLWAWPFAGPSHYSYEHETTLAELNPWLKGLVTGQMANSDMANLLNTVFVPASSGAAGGWNMRANSCYAK